MRDCRRENRDLRRENEVLREAAEPLIHQAAARERFAFIYVRRDRFSVRLLCRVLVTDRCNYHGWVRAAAERRVREYDEKRLTELRCTRRIRRTGYRASPANCRHRASRSGGAWWPG